MMNEKIQTALNDQINAELHSAYIYLSMSAYYQDQDLPGLASWMRVQAMEELTHADRFFKFIVEKDGRVLLNPIKEVETEWESAAEAMMAAHNHEHYISGRINDLVDLAHTEKDHATYNFLQWFVSEQVEEESQTWEAYRKLKLVGTEGAGLYMVDQEMGTRVFVMPPAPGQTGA